VDSNVPVHPVQRGYGLPREKAQAPQVVTLRAYEVYSHVYGPQEALIQEGCRGGFGVSELIAFLYARSFPQSEWRMRVDEALTGLRL
jgi:hypothetical protein